MNEKGNSILRGLAFFSQLGFTLSIPILIGVWAGRWLDDKLQTGNTFLIILLLTGTAAVISTAYVELMAMAGKKKRK